MEFQRRARLGSRHVKLVLCIVAVLALCRGIVLANESVPIVGDHLNYVPFTTELADGQPLQLEVIMADASAVCPQLRPNHVQTRESHGAAHGKASVTRRESQAAVGCSVTAVNTIFLRSRARMIVT